MSINTLGRYRIIREIARSNDIVYEAVDTGINRRVALKELLLPQNLVGAQKRERIERFYREARAAGSLSHPNIVTIYEASEDQGRHFIAMEFLEGKPLRDMLDMEGRLSIDRAVEIVRQVCDALTYAHSRGVVHRDIKPDNIHILPSEQIKLTDFGIARIMEEPSITADGQVFGTPSYMSPEQIAGKPLDHRTDLFSLGIVLYEMLTGRKPFTGDGVVTITYNIMNQDVIVPPTVPPYLERVLLRSLAKDPGLRYQSATEMAADLDPGSFPAMQPGPRPDPFSATGPLQPPQPPDRFGGLKPGGISMPRVPRPVVSAETKYFLKVMLAVVAVCSVVLFFIWALSAGYRGYQERVVQEEINSHIRKGMAYFEQESYQAAIDEFSHILKLSTDEEIDQTARRNIATAYVNLGMKAERGGDPTRALAFFEQGTSYDDSYPEAHLLLGNALDKLGRQSEALAEWQRAVDVGAGGEAAMAARQNVAAVYHKYGDEAYLQGNVDTAVGWWRKAVETAPGTNAGMLAQDKIDRVLGRGR